MYFFFNVETVPVTEMEDQILFYLLGMLVDIGCIGMLPYSNIAMALRFSTSFWKY